MTERITTDILIVGGSLAGLSAAITAKEANPDLQVTVVEKYTAGYAGKANRGAGILVTLGDSRPEDFVDYHVRNIGDYLNKQDDLLKYASHINSSVDCVDKWSGGKVCKNADGSFKTLKWLAQISGQDENGKRTFSESDHFPWTLVSIELDYMVNIRRYAVNLGIAFMDRIGIVDILTNNKVVSGAQGYHIDSGECFVFQAKSVVLATGSQNYRIMPMWSPGRGEGLAAAWRAGAEFTNCEFGSFYNWTSLDHFESNMGVEFALYNNHGENVGIKHTRGEHPDVDQHSLAEWYLQTRDGNGPMHYRIQENPLMPYLTSVLASNSYYDRPYADRFWGSLFFNAFSQQTSDIVVPGLIGEFSGLRVDSNMATSVPGLFAAGDICYGGSRVAGAVPPPPGRVRGSGIAFALYSGRVAGPEVARFTAAAIQNELVKEQISDIECRFGQNINSAGTISIADFLNEIHKVVQPLGNSLYRSEDRMKAALKKIQILKTKLPLVKARDPHELFECNEFESMLICAELFFTSSLLRRESRGWFLREDYPEKSRDLIWYVLKNEEETIISYDEKVPIQKYPVSLISKEEM